VKPKVTVVIPTINRDSLATALDSLDQQSFRDFNVILVDDSVNQNVKSSRHNILRTGGQAGVSRARNLAMKQIDTEFIALLDDDDVWHHEYLERQISNLISLQVDFSVTSATVQNRKRPKALLQIGMDPFELLYGKSHLLRSKSYLPTSSYMFRTIIVEEILFDETIVDRENLKFIRECFIGGYKVFQDSRSLVTINYKSKESLSRINLEQEIEWAYYLGSIKADWADNFLIESARNLIRIGNQDSAKKTLELITPNARNCHKTILKLLTR
jgi:glycosyltransferase involved in cell wall biosynthesis